MIWWFLAGTSAAGLLWGLLTGMPLFRRESFRKTDRILTILFLVLAFFDQLLPDLWSDYFENTPELLRAGRNAGFSLLRLVNAAMVVCIPIALSYHRKLFSRMVCLWGLFGYLGNCLYAPVYLYHYTHALTAPYGEAVASVTGQIGFRGALFAALELLRLFLVLRVLQLRREDLRFTDVRDSLAFAGGGLLLLAVNMPVQFPAQLLGGWTSIIIDVCNGADLLWLAWLPAEILILTLAFRKRSREDRYILLLVLSLALVFQFSHFYRSLSPIPVRRLPLQLCNIGCYLIPAAVFFKKKSIGCYALAVHVFGALAAVLLCDTPGEKGLLYPANVHYIAEHSGDIVIPVLMLTLGFLAPLEKRDLRHVVRIYSLYYTAAFAAGLAANSIAACTGNALFRCNYMFMFDRDTAAELLPVLGSFYDASVTIGGCVTLTLAQPVMYLLYLAIGIGVFFLCYALSHHSDRRSTSSGKDLA